MRSTLTDQDVLPCVYLILQGGNFTEAESSTSNHLDCLVNFLFLLLYISIYHLQCLQFQEVIP